MVYILLLLSILAKSHLPAKTLAVVVNKTHCGLVLPLGSQWHNPPSVLLTVALQNSCGTQSHALPSVPCGTEGRAGREAVRPEGVGIKATSAPPPVPTAATASPICGGPGWGSERVRTLSSSQPEWLGGEEQETTHPKKCLEKKPLFFLMARERDGLLCPERAV